MAQAATLRLQRALDDGVQALGVLFALAASGMALGGWVTIERPWKDNRFRESCIPPGRYWVEHRWSQKFKHHLHVTDVEGRTWILIHAANDWQDIVGCIGPGKQFGHGTGDERLDVLVSSASLAEIRALVPKPGIWMEVYAPPTEYAAQVSADRPETPGRLARGATGPGVEALQRALIAAGDLTPPVDGRFGPNTERGLRAFQARHGLTVDGIAGPETWEAVDRLGL